MAGSGEVPARGFAFPDLAALLWTVRESLELVLFKLAEVRLILTTGSSRWLARADSELRAALEQMQSVELLRAAEVEELAGRLGRSAGTTLAEMLDAAPEPWPAVLAEHRVALARLLAEIDLVAGENRGLLTAALTPALTERPCDAHTARRPRRCPLADPVAQAGFQSALATTTGIPQLSLHDFLA